MRTLWISISDPELCRLSNLAEFEHNFDFYHSSNLQFTSIYINLPSYPELTMYFRIGFCFSASFNGGLRFSEWPILGPQLMIQTPPKIIRFTNGASHGKKTWYPMGWCITMAILTGKKIIEHRMLGHPGHPGTLCSKKGMSFMVRVQRWMYGNVMTFKKENNYKNNCISSISSPPIGQTTNIPNMWCRHDLVSQDGETVKICSKIPYCTYSWYL